MSVSDELDYQETIALLQEEIVRLEEELRGRDEADSGPAPEAPRGHDAAGEAARRQVDGLLAELAARDETIGLLLEQARLFEEAETANLANWEQLNQWVEELERRVEQNDGRGGEGALRAELEAERRKAEAERQAAAADRDAWGLRRQELESEAERLRATLAKAARAPGTADVAAIEALERENRRLREASSELVRVSAAAAEAESLRDRLQGAQDELGKARRELQQRIDDQKRQAMEREALVADLRSQLANESLRFQEGQVKVAVAAAAGGPNPLLDPDMRIRALRQHLQEIHEREEQERARRTLSARLSRLWHRTGPQG